MEDGGGGLWDIVRCTVCELLIRLSPFLSLTVGDRKTVGMERIIEGRRTSKEHTVSRAGWRERRERRKARLAIEDIRCGRREIYGNVHVYPHDKRQC